MQCWRLHQYRCAAILTQILQSQNLTPRWLTHFWLPFFMRWNCCFKRKRKKNPANQQCSKPDVHTSGNKGSWMLVDLVRPPVTPLTISWTLSKCTLLAFCCPYKKASVTACFFSVSIQLMFPTLLLKIVPNKAHPPNQSSRFALAFVNASSSCTLINALMQNCNWILCQVEMEIERCSNTELPSHY